MFVGMTTPRYTLICWSTFCQVSTYNLSAPLLKIILGYRILTEASKYQGLIIRPVKTSLALYCILYMPQFRSWHCAVVMCLVPTHLHTRIPVQMQIPELSLKRGSHVLTSCWRRMAGKRPCVHILPIVCALSAGSHLWRGWASSVWSLSSCSEQDIRSSTNSWLELAGLQCPTLCNLIAKPRVFLYTWSVVQLHVNKIILGVWVN